MCVKKNVMSIRALFALEFPEEMSSMTFPLSGWLIPFEIPAMLLGRVTALVNSSTAPAAASAPPLPPQARMMELAAGRAGLMLGLAVVHCDLCFPVMGLKCFLINSFFFFPFFLACCFLEGLKNIRERCGRQINGDFWSTAMVIWKF